MPGARTRKPRASSSPGRWLRWTPVRSSALKQGAEAFNKGNLGIFTRDILPGVRAEPRLPPEVYKIISDAIQQTQLGGADPQATATAASQQLDAFLATYKGAPMM